LHQLDRPGASALLSIMYFLEKLDLAALERAELGALPIQCGNGHQPGHNEVLQACWDRVVRHVLVCVEKTAHQISSSHHVPARQSIGGNASRPAHQQDSANGNLNDKEEENSRHLRHLRDGGRGPVIELQHAIVQRGSHGNCGACLGM
jgi:hypothetical protein